MDDRYDVERGSPRWSPTSHHEQIAESGRSLKNGQRHVEHSHGSPSQPIKSSTISGSSGWSVSIGSSSSPTPLYRRPRPARNEAGAMHRRNDVADVPIPAPQAGVQVERVAVPARHAARALL